MFARDVDILQVPFAGSYRSGSIESPIGNNDGVYDSNELFDLNSLSMDLAFAEDTDVLDDPTVLLDIGSTGAFNWREYVGRFCPIDDPPPSTTGTDIDDGQYTNAGYEKDPLRPDGR